jgi:hypothetical protein
MIIRGLRGGQFLTTCLFKLWQVLADKLPENWRRDSLVAVTKDVANSRNLLPGDFRTPRL